MKIGKALMIFLSKKQCTLLVFLVAFFLINVQLFAQSRSALLKGISEIASPVNGELGCATYIFNYQPEIIKTVALPATDPIQLNDIVTTTLGKGKIVILGSPAYFSENALQQQSIKQFLRNAIAWGVKNKKPKVELWESSEPLKAFLTKSNYIVVPERKNQINPSTNVLILAEDVNDSLAVKGIERFVQHGGLLIFASPLPAIYKSRPAKVPELQLNNLLVKAGVYQIYNLFLYQSKNSGATDTIPFYLHMRSILEKLRGNYKQMNPNEVQIVMSSLVWALVFNDQNARVVRDIKSILEYKEGEIIIPSETNVVYKDSSKAFFRYCIQQALVEKQLEDHPNPGYIAPAAKFFPGEVASTAPGINEKITIPVKAGTQGLWEPSPAFSRWYSTGLYVPAGKKVVVTIDPIYASHNLKIQIGAHNDQLFHMDYFVREPLDLTKTFDIIKDTTEVYSRYGGILFIKVPDSSQLKTVEANVNGAVKYPYFQLGVTSVDEWKKSIRNFGAPWAELASDKIIFTVPSYRIRNLDDPEKLLQFWNEVMDADARLASISTTRIHPERIIIDKQVAFGYLFTSPEKIVAPDDDGCRDMLDEAYMRLNGSWGHFHELGHRHQFWGIDFPELGEVTENLYSMYVFDKVLGKGIYSHPDISSKEAVIKKIKKYMTDGADYKKWSEDPFLALCMYIEIIEGFGWQPIEQVYKQYRELAKESYPATDQEKRDFWFKIICSATKKNLSLFFDKWAIPVSGNAKSAAEIYPKWLPAELQ